VAAIGKFCRNLRRLELKVESCEEDIKEVVANNPHLVHINACLGGAYFGMAICPFLQFLMDTRTNIRSLALRDYIKDKSVAVVGAFILHFLSTLESLSLVECMGFEQSGLKNDGSFERRSLSYNFGFMPDSTSDFCALLANLPKVTKLLFSGIGADFSQVVGSITRLYGTSLKELHFYLFPPSEQSLVELISGCEVLTSLRIDSLGKVNFVESLQAQFPTVDIEVRDII
jgi:hypothetical protein